MDALSPAPVPLAEAAIPASPPVASPRADVALKPAHGPIEVLTRKPADKQQIISFCENRGLRFDTFDIDVINERFAKVGHPGFTLIERPRGRAGIAA